jgi:hypothetical protein
MSDFILEYEVLEKIAKNSNSLGKSAKEYSERLQSKIISGINDITGASSGYLVSANDLVRDKINALNQKSQAFYSFAEQVSYLLKVAEEADQEVADAIAAQREYFLDHHESLRIDDWKAKLLDLLVDVKNSIPLLNLLADILKGLETVFESLMDAVKHWYECGGGKYIINVVWSIGEVALAVAGIVAAVAVLATLGAGFFAICGIIGASIALVNAVTNVATSFRAADAATDGNPAWAVIYGKQDKLSDVLRQTNFGDGTLKNRSNLGAGALDVTETFCDIVGIAEMVGIAKLFKGDAFKKLKNGTLSFSDLKNSMKNGIVDLKSNIKNGYADYKNGNMLDNLGFHKSGTDAGIKNIINEGYSGDLMTPEEAARYSDYWKNSGIGSDNTWNGFIKANPNATIDDYNLLLKDQSPWPMGQDGTESVLKAGDRFFMAVENNAPDNMIGGFGVKEKIPSTQFVRENLAVKSNWKNTCNVIREFEVNEGVSLSIFQGPVGPQIDLNIDKYLPGDMNVTQYNLFSKLGNGKNRSDYVHIVDEYWVD